MNPIIAYDIMQKCPIIGPWLEKWKASSKPVLVPEWDDYFMAMAYLVSTRSKDAQTKHGCVIVDSNKRILGVGYNSFPRNLPDSVLPNLRPHKYKFMTHAERNALANCVIRPEGATAYVTGQPCIECAKQLYQEGVTTWICADAHGSVLIDEEEKAVFQTLVKLGNIKHYIIKPDFSLLKSLTLTS